ncbi:hypothetical protein C8R43DRAFT_1140852 [Mycena crocata]|nr:hypothetical protein C8R43DRAFT_1140852 [Mycena crocata]
MSFPESVNQRLISGGEGTMYYMFGLVGQTFFFGVYTLLISLSTRMLLKRTLTTRVNKVMFAVTTFMYLLSAAYWAYSVADGVDRMHGYVDQAINPFRPPASADLTEITQWSPLFNSLTSINYVLSDAVVIWRAWVICMRNHRKYLWVAAGFLTITVISVGVTIAFRITGFVVSPKTSLARNSLLNHAIDVSQIITLGMSLLSNITATAVVGATAWRHWRTIRATFSEKKNTRTSQILLLVVESGVFYCISSLTVLVASLIRLPQGTLGNLYSPVNVQIAGAYPTIVLLLVSPQRSLSDSTFADDTYSGSAPSHPIRFGTPGTISTANRSQNLNWTSIHFSQNTAMTTLSDPETMDIPSNLNSPNEKGGRDRLSDSFV